MALDSMMSQKLFVGKVEALHQKEGRII
jgi:hypothetical protein